jgi:hypothetical protein
VLVSASFLFRNPESFWKKMTEELGIVLISVWGVSLFYETFLAARHFNRFQQNLTTLIRRGETNAAVCEHLGILEIHTGRRSYEDRHSFAREAENIGAGDVVRITGRSLIFLMYSWRDLKHLLKNGARLQLCMLNPTLRNSPLNYLAGYSVEETELAIHRFVNYVRPWLVKEKPSGTVEVRFHTVHILDSYLEIIRPGHSRAAWDLNFGEGTEERRVFYLDGSGPLGRNLSQGRYQLIWDRAEEKFLYKDLEIQRDELNRLVPFRTGVATDKGKPGPVEQVG